MEVANISQMKGIHVGTALLFQGVGVPPPVVVFYDDVQTSKCVTRL
jgi:hypothetical protein